MLWSFHFGLGSVLRGGLVFWLLPLGYFVCCNLGRAHRWFSLLPIFVIAFSILLFTCRCWIDHQVIVRSMFELADFERRKSFTSLSYSLLSICFPANLVVWIFLGWRQTVFSRQGKGVGSKKSADDSVGKNWARSGCINQNLGRVWCSGRAEISKSNPKTDSHYAGAENGGTPILATPITLKSFPNFGMYQFGTDIEASLFGDRNDRHSVPKKLT